MKKRKYRARRVKRVNGEDFMRRLCRMTAELAPEPEAAVPTQHCTVKGRGSADVPRAAALPFAVYLEA